MTATLFAAVLVSAAAARLPEWGSQFRISTTGTDGDTSRPGFRPAAAYNSADNEYLAIWFADLLEGAPSKAEVFAQRLSAGGEELGGDVRISTTGDDQDLTRRAITSELDVAYSSEANEYLAVWASDLVGGPDTEFEIRAQRISAAGEEIGPDLRISHAGIDGDPATDAFDPTVSYSPAADEYLVVWLDDRLGDQVFEVFAQRISPAGDEIGPEFRVSTTGADVDPSQDVFRPDVAYNSADDQYLVIWGADILAGTPRKPEVFGQRLSAGGAELGGDFRVSTSGADVADGRGVGAPAVGYNAVANRYLVAWNGDGGQLDPGDSDIFAQRLSSTGEELGADFRVSTTQPEGDSSSGGFFPAVAGGAAADEWLVAWIGGLQAGTDAEIFAQRISGLGVQRGVDFQISNTPPGEDRPGTGEFPALAYNDCANEYLAVWDADALATPREFEIFGQRLPAPGNTHMACGLRR